MNGTRAATTTVRVRLRTNAILSQPAAAPGQTRQAVPAGAVEAYRRRHFIEQANADYPGLRNDPAAWAEELAECAAWDAMLADRLKEASSSRLTPLSRRPAR